jgi:hypothetical protein
MGVGSPPVSPESGRRKLKELLSLCLRSVTEITIGIYIPLTN